MSANNLYEDLQKMRRQTVQVALQPGSRRTDPRSGEIRTDPMLGTNPMTFEIHSVSANEIIEADQLVSAKPPVIYQEEPNPKGVGMIRVMNGYDLDHPDYIAERQAQVPRRDAAICLFGCPALAESTPGDGVIEKIDRLLADIPGVLLDWLCQEIETISIITAVGSEAVSSFLAEGSESGKDSPNTKPRSQAGAKSKRSSASTGPTSTTKSGKRRTTGG